MALYYTKGTISQMSEVKSGTSESGRGWAFMNMMIDVPGYQGSITKLVFSVSGERVNDALAFKVGDKVEIGWTIYAREYKDRFYNTVDLVSIKSLDQQKAQAAPAPQKMQFSQEELNPAAHDDLPW